MIDQLVETSIAYLEGQVKAGADVLQIFDSWAGSLPEPEFQQWVVAPTAKIAGALAESHPNVPIIGFPKGATALLEGYGQATGVAAIGCDTSCPMHAMQAVSDAGKVAQGNLDPLLLVAGGDAMDARVDEILQAMNGRRFIFNLGHGIVPQTPPENVARLMKRIRGSQG